MISHNLKVLRKINGYTQESLAEKLGISRQSVAKWERNESSPDLSNLLELSKIYNVTLDDLVNYRNTEEEYIIAPRGKHMFGTVVIEEDNSIVIPKEAMDLFDLEAGSEMVLLADEIEGLALVKKELFMERLEDLHKGLNRNK